MISENTFNEFQKAVEEEHGVTLDPKEAKEILQGMVNYFDLLAKLHHRDVLAEKEKESLSGGNAPKPSEHLEDVL